MFATGKALISRRQFSRLLQRLCRGGHGAAVCLAPFGTSTSNPVDTLGEAAQDNYWSEVVPFEFTIRMRQTMKAPSGS
jgi:hypothetical protein